MQTYDKGYNPKGNAPRDYSQFDNLLAPFYNLYLQLAGIVQW